MNVTYFFGDTHFRYWHTLFILNDCDIFIHECALIFAVCTSKHTSLLFFNLYVPLKIWRNHYENEIIALKIVHTHYFSTPSHTQETSFYTQYHLPLSLSSVFVFVFWFLSVCSGTSLSLVFVFVLTLRLVSLPRVKPSKNFDTLNHAFNSSCVAI